MGYLGLEKGKVTTEELTEELKTLGLVILKIDEISLRTSFKGWVNFIRVEVIGFIEGVGKLLAMKHNALAFEWGDHTILGEISAKLWYEGAKIFYPSGKYENIPVVTFDGFLNIRIPSENIKGINGTIVIGQKKFKLPLTLDDLFLLLKFKKEAIRAIERAIEAYGKKKILSEEAIEFLESLKKKEKRMKMEIDYEAGYIVFMNGEGKISTVPLFDYLLGLIINDKLDNAVNIIKKAPKNIKNSLFNELKNEIEYLKVLKREKDAKKIINFLEKIKEKK